MLVSDLVSAMQRIAPLEYAEDWDRVGLQVGSHDAELAGPLLLTIDLTEAVIAEAIEMGAGAVVSYHPPIFQDLGAVTDATPKQRVILAAARAGIAVYTPHTALDAAPGGVTDWLCEGLSGGADGKIEGDIRALEPHDEASARPEVKIVTFLPESEVDTVRNALASAGAGRIGAYTACSFTVTGHGTFLGDDTTKPAVGESGRFETIPEVRMEMVCPRRSVALALQTLRRFHPYEEPPVDVYELGPRPRRAVGAGRRLVLDRPVALAELASRLKSFLGNARVQVGELAHSREPVETIGVVPGAGESLAPLAASEGCEVFVTGEMRHHHVLGAIHDGMHVLLAGHTNTERGFLKRLAVRVHDELPGCECRVSVRDGDPLRVV